MFEIHSILYILVNKKGRTGTQDNISATIFWANTYWLSCNSYFYENFACKKGCRSIPQSRKWLDSCSAEHAILNWKNLNRLKFFDIDYNGASEQKYIGLGSYSWIFTSDIALEIWMQASLMLKVSGRTVSGLYHLEYALSLEKNIHINIFRVYINKILNYNNS